MLRLAVRVRRDEAEIVLAELLTLAPSGVEEVAVGADVVEYAVYGAPGELPALPELTAVAGGALVDVRTSEVADDWDRRWREFHRPLVLDGGRFVVRPPWEAALGSEIELIIDPGQAFGTGAHATTRLCLELMLELAGSGDAGEPARRGGFLDLGCGSGVLAIAAARLGWEPVVAADFDPVAVEAARANAHVNGVSVEVRRHDLRVRSGPRQPDRRREPPPSAAAGLGSAPGRRRRRGRAQLPERVIASGLLEGEADEIAAAFSPVGLRESGRRVSGDWAALLLERGRG